MQESFLQVTSHRTTLRFAVLAFAGGALTPPLTKGMLRAPLETHHKVPPSKLGGIEQAHEHTR